MPPSILRRFVVLEGLDGSGTTTQLRLASERLAREGLPHFPTCEPTDGAIGKLIRTILTGKVPAHPCTVARLFAADRHEHLHAPGGILERSGRGELVVCDRYLFSSLAYQSIDCPLEQVQALNADFPLPELLLFIDTPVEICQARLDRRKAREIYDGLAFQRRVRQAYRAAIRAHESSGMRVGIVEGDRPPQAIHEDVWTLIAGLPIPKV